MGEWTGRDGVVTLPGGARVRVSSIPDAADVTPAAEFAVLLGAREPRHFPADEVRFVRWVEYNYPVSTPAAVAAIRAARERAATERVLIATARGRGRAAPMLSGMAIMDGLSVDKAIAWIKETFLSSVLDNVMQRPWLEEIFPLLRA